MLSFAVGRKIKNKLFDTGIEMEYILNPAKIRKFFENLDVCDRFSENEFEKKLSLGINSNGEFDPGSERTLAACLIHASRA